MSGAITPAMAEDLDEAAETNLSDNPRFEDIVAKRYSRRAALFGGMGATAVAMFGLAACDGSGGGDAPPNITVSVNAGASQSVSAGRVVTLTGSSSSAFAGVTAVGSWSQVSGPPVTLTAVSGAVSTFIAPAVAAPTPLVFQYTASTGSSNTSAATTVTVSPPALGFASVARNLNDVVTVPAGYTATVLYALGDPIAAGVPAYANNGTDTNFAARAGDHHDALYYFGLAATGAGRDDSSNTRGILVNNHENITQSFLHPRGATGTGAGESRPEGETLKEMEAHGVSMVEVTRNAQGAWSYVQASALNRRVTPLTVVSINGPVRGDAQVRTQFSPDGAQGRGTINNCANGYSAWGTYLTCEENWAFYFRRDRGDNANRPAKTVASLNRYGVREGTPGNYGWTTVNPSDSTNTAFRRWNATAVASAPADGAGDFRNEPHQFGWVVEMDPYDPASMPRKRTALGRFAHEGCWPAPFVAGRRPVYYMGDDNRGDYMYKFVSAAAWDPADAQRADRLAVGDKYLDNGTLYVARFNEDGTGTWLPLVFGQGALTPANAAYPFANQADVLINTRLAGDALGATRMDRPEWGAVNPLNNEVYMTMTNSNFSNRSPDKTNAANPRSFTDQRIRSDGSVVDQTGNPHGHIVRFREAGGNNEATTFQ